MCSYRILATAPPVSGPAQYIYIIIIIIIIFTIIIMVIIIIIIRLVVILFYIPNGSPICWL